VKRGALPLCRHGRLAQSSAVGLCGEELPFRGQTGNEFIIICRYSIETNLEVHATPLVCAPRKMPPKKSKAAADNSAPKALLGRPSNNVSIGIVGLPNVGKSTLFNLLGKMSVPAENFPFCTIDPTDSKVPVPVSRAPWSRPRAWH
jgi:hypothetical protein